MPVWLNTIPPVAAKVPRPNLRRWLVALLIILFIGFALTLWFWTKDRTGFIFWFTAVGLPICGWGLAFGARRMAYKMQQVAASTWNSEREALIKSEIKRGQRFAYLLDAYIETPAGQGANRSLDAINKSVPFVALQPSRSGSQLLRYAPLAAFDQPDSMLMLTDCLNNIAVKIKPILQKIPDDIPCYCVLEIDRDLQPQAEQILLDTLKKQSPHVFRLISGQSLEAIDAWLDTRWDVPSLLLIVSIGYNSKPVDDDGEAISSILLSNRPSRDIPCATRFHRPEKSHSDNLSHCLSQAILWGNISSETITAAWVAGQDVDEGGGWSQACEQNQLHFSMTKANKMIDPILGGTGKTAPWIATALAEASMSQENTPDAQLIAVQPQRENVDIWITVISRHTESKESVTHV
ncbi:membrane protein [Morganella sp. EGD-HP17]|uniref:membrane protein n=1 Tax=Morganella sp. EGD-HP17 TaxID=1435146 RepID=UPI0003F9028F|nr:membrane protein [Morganella sp. EGD-HP17]ETO41770.1 membrane protein [Morganella sp. EGD-HP17]